MLNTLLPELTADELTGRIAAQLAAAAALHRSDHRLFPDGRDDARLRQAEAIHAEWGRWIDEAVLVRDQAMGCGGYLVGLHDLRCQIAIARAYVQEAPRDFAATLDDVREGRIVPEPFDVKEARRELRLRARA